MTPTAGAFVMKIIRDPTRRSSQNGMREKRISMQFTRTICMAFLAMTVSSPVYAQAVNATLLGTEPARRVFSGKIDRTNRQQTILEIRKRTFMGRSGAMTRMSRRPMRRSSANHDFENKWWVNLKSTHRPEASDLA